MRPTQSASGSTAYKPSACGQAAKAWARGRGCKPKSCGSQGQLVASHPAYDEMFDIFAQALDDIAARVDREGLRAA